MNTEDQSEEAGSPAPRAPGKLDRPGHHLSLENVHGSVLVPHHEASFWEQWRAFVGPAILVSVGYMDPGNWGTGKISPSAVATGIPPGRAGLTG
jgi:hypothetical protein